MTSLEKVQNVTSLEHPHLGSAQSYPDLGADWPERLDIAASKAHPGHVTLGKLFNLTNSKFAYLCKKRVNRMYLIELCGDTVNTKCLCT